MNWEDNKKDSTIIDTVGANRYIVFGHKKVLIINNYHNLPNLCYNIRKTNSSEVISMQKNKTKDEMFEAIYRTYQHDVYKISLYYIGDEYIAQDIAQKTFYKFYLHFDNVNLESVRSYLLRCARNLSYNWLRDMNREQGDYIDNIPEESAILLSAEDEYLRDEKYKARNEFVKGILLELREENESWYDIVNLIYCLNKSHEQAAKELGMSRDVLYNKLSRAKRWVRRNYEDEFLKL